MFNVFERENLRILVVEDTHADVFLIKFYLEELDPDFYQIESVDNLAEAHERLKNEVFDAVLLDFHLPDSDGMVTLTSSIEKFPQQIFIVLTGFSDKSIGVEAVKNGAQDFLEKGSLDGKALDSSIKFAVQRNMLRKRLYNFLAANEIVERINKELNFIIEKDTNLFDASKRVKKYLEIETVPKTLDDFVGIFDSAIQIKEKLLSSKVDEISSFNINSRGDTYRISFSSTQNNSIISGVLKKLD